MNNLNNLNTLNYFSKQPTDSIYYAGTGASLDLNFARNKSLMDRISGNNLVTFTRASSGTYTDSNGVLQTAVTNAPRFDHNPVTGESLGLLVEEQRTNSIRNNTMQGAVAGVIGSGGSLPTNWISSGLSSLTVDVLGAGTDNGINYIDIKLSGTTSSTFGSILFGSISEAVASSGQTWNASVFAGLAGGSLANITTVAIRHFGYTSGGALTESSTEGIISLGTTFARTSVSYTLTNATTARLVSGIRFNWASGAAIDITLRIGMPQLEQGAFATSVIPTTTAAATRSADIASITGTNFSSWYRQDEGTNLIEFRETDRTGTRTPRSLSDGTSSNRIDANISSSLGVNNRVLLAGVAYNPGNLTLSAANTVNKHVISAAPGSAIAVVNGTLSTESAPPSLPVVDRLVIGADSIGTTPFTGHIRRFTYFPQRISNANLQRITQ